MLLKKIHASIPVENLLPIDVLENLVALNLAIAMQFPT